MYVYFKLCARACMYKTSSLTQKLLRRDRDAAVGRAGAEDGRETGVCASGIAAAAMD